MATCNDCIHRRVCVILAFPDAFENTKWDKEPCDHFKPEADFVTVSEYRTDTKKAVENTARDIIEQIEDNFEIGYGGAYEFKMLLSKLKIEYGLNGGKDNAQM